MDRGVWQATVHGVAKAQSMAYVSLIVYIFTNAEVHVMRQIFYSLEFSENREYIFVLIVKVQKLGLFFVPSLPLCGQNFDVQEKDYEGGVESVKLGKITHIKLQPLESSQEAIG